jgi:hypothetical protein
MQIWTRTARDLPIPFLGFLLLLCSRLTNCVADRVAGFRWLVSGRPGGGVTSAIRPIRKSPNPGRAEPR